jgi:hypothetical protein
MKPFITKCKLLLSTDQVFIQFDEFNIEIIINVPNSKIDNINSELTRMNYPIQIIELNNVHYSIFLSLTSFINSFLTDNNKINDGHILELKEIVNSINKNTDCFIDKFNKLILESDNLIL